MKSGLSKTLKVEKQQIDHINDLLSMSSPDYDRYAIEPNSIVWQKTIDIDGGLEIGVKVYSGSPGDSLWVEPGLFDKFGYEYCLTIDTSNRTDNRIEGIWSIRYKDVDYTLIIKEK